MTTLVLVLAAGMALGDGPEKVSGEMEVAQRLDLSGEWKGTWKESNGRVWDAWLRNGTLSGTQVKAMGRIVGIVCKWEGFDEGRGKVRAKDWRCDYLGIYRYEGDRIVICYRLDVFGRPNSFRAGDGCDLLILHRIKPGK
jgi:hypothetical protein